MYNVHANFIQGRKNAFHLLKSILTYAAIYCNTLLVAMDKNHFT